ncbi:MAG TPA: hypothetical protein VLH35_08470 [Candidatus Acidoferrales bacterium]|nr:hypothetical protein [Candidatus Acidoferrales bacterium]
MKTIGLTLLAALLLLAALTANVTLAQNQATVSILDTSGGTIDPSPGTYTYNDGTEITVTATSTTTGISFSFWVINTTQGSRTSTDNPLNFSATGGTTYTIQAIFQVSETISRAPPTNMASAAIVVVVAGTGGTTIPAPGRYALANATALELTAMPNDGWTFSHWVITGNITSHGTSPLNLEPTDNPYNVNHGYGQTYNYQPVFTQTSASPSPTIPELSTIVLVALLVAMLPFVVLARKIKKNTTN